jgi:hypothetical protein
VHRDGRELVCSNGAQALGHAERIGPRYRGEYRERRCPRSTTRLADFPAPMTQRCGEPCPLCRPERSPLNGSRIAADMCGKQI